jgi:hypothetical protein
LHFNIYITNLTAQLSPIFVLKVAIELFYPTLI